MTGPWTLALIAFVIIAAIGTGAVVWRERYQKRAAEDHDEADWI